MDNSTLGSIYDRYLGTELDNLAEHLDPIGIDSLWGSGVAVGHIEEHALPGHEESVRYHVTRILAIQNNMLAEHLLSAEECAIH